MMMLHYIRNLLLVRVCVCAFAFFPSESLKEKMTWKAMNVSSAWKSALNKALSSVRRRKSRPTSVKPEWTKFSAAKLDILFTLNDLFADDELADILDDDLAATFASDEDFLAQCLLVCLEDKQIKGKFESLFAFVEKRSAEIRVDWKALFARILRRCLEIECSALLEEVLSLAHDSNPPKLGVNPPALNDPTFLRACEADNYEMIQPFVNRGYRLSSKLLRSQTGAGWTTGDEDDGVTWKDYVEMPLFLFQSKRKEKFSSFIDDEVQDVQLLKTMSNPGYVLAAYVTALEKSGLEKMDPPANCGCNESFNYPRYILFVTTEHCQK